MLQTRIYVLFITLSLFVQPHISAQWGYTIGQEEIPKVVIQDAKDYKVYPGHPRLFFRDTDLSVIRERISGLYKPEWDKMLSFLKEKTLNISPSVFAEGRYLKHWMIGRNMTFAAVVTEDESYINWSKQWMETLIAAGPVGNDDHYRGRLMSLAVAYDWLYKWLTEDEKARLVKAIIEHIDKNWYFSTDADYVGGHSRWGNYSLFMGLVVLVDEKPELRNKLLTVRDHWINGYFPVQGWIANEGGYHMGWAYSAAYLSAKIHCVMSSATNDCVYFPWQNLLPLFWLYGRQGDGLYANTGDAYSVTPALEEEQELLMISSGIYKNPYALASSKKSEDQFATILYGDKRIEKLVPDDTKRPLPLSRNFGNAGVVIARDRWDEETTLLQFRSVPFYSANHHHRDENTFTIHYKAPLAIDAGLYDEGAPKGGYGSTHWLNYFTRTVAHNGILVFDPDQKYYYGKRLISNDGGQPYLKEEPVGLEDLLPGGKAHLDGIIHYQDTDQYMYAVGDATKAYDAERVNLAQREVVYLRKTPYKHPVIIVFDRVESSSAEYEKKFLLHTVNKPIVKGKIAVAENAGGRLSCLTLYPENVNIDLIGGPGKEAWVDGINYPVEKGHWPKPQIQSGEWRLEVKPTELKKRDYFLHVFFIDDSNAQLIKHDAVKLLEKEDRIGLHMEGWNILFSKKGDTAVFDKSK